MILYHYLLLIYIQKAGIDVVRALFPWNLSEFHTWEIIYVRKSNDQKLINTCSLTAIKQL